MDRDLEDDLRAAIVTTPHWPKKGVMFRDIWPALHNPKLRARIIRELSLSFQDAKVDAIVGIESRGFVIAMGMAEAMGKALVPVRKLGKLPPPVIGENYSLEYGSETIEISKGIIRKGERVVIADDLLATGGTARAAANLIERSGGIVVGYAFVIELPALRGRQKLGSGSVVSLVSFEGE